MSTQVHREQIEVSELVPVEAGTVEAIQRAEIDVQISTAKRYPRSIEVFKKRAIAMATIDEETAESCIYRRPVGKGPDGKMKFAEGLSVRMAEIVGASYGNMRVQAMILEQTDRYVKARGAAIDLESNFAAASEVIESTLDRNGKPFSERMRVVVAKAALAKARRDATFQVVPKSLARPIEREVQKLLNGDAASLTKRRARVVEWIKSLGIDVARVYDTLGVKGEGDLTPEHLETLQGVKTAMKDGEVSVDEAFPKVAATPKFEGPTPVPAASDPTVAAAKTSKAATNADNEIPMGDAAPVVVGSYSAIMKLLEADGVTEAQVIKHCRSIKMASEKQNKLDELSDLKLNQLIKAWPGIKETVKAL